MSIRTRQRRMAKEGSRVRSLRDVVSSLCWMSLLLLLVVASFLTLRYDNISWIYFSAASYAYASVYLIAVTFGVRANVTAVVSALPLLILMAGAIIWLLLQTHIPWQHALWIERESIQAPSWFKPSSVISIDPINTLWRAATSLLILVFFVLVLLQLINRVRLKHLLIVFTGVGATHGALALVDYFSGLQLVSGRQIDGHFDVARGVFVNRNHFASFVVLCLFGPIAMRWRKLLSDKPSRLHNNSKRRLTNWLFTLLLGLTAIAVVLSQSRAAAASLLVSAAVVTAYVLMKVAKAKSLWSSFHKSSFHLSSLSAAALLAVIVVFVYLNSELHSRLSSSAFSIGERAEQWLLTLELIKGSWLTGYGGGSYGAVFQWLRDYVDLRQVIYNQSHNDYLHIWVEQGLIGLAIWSCLLILVAYHIVRRLQRTRSGFERSVYLAASIVISASLMQAAVDFNLQATNIRLYFFVIIAVIFALPSIQHRE